MNGLKNAQHELVDNLRVHEHVSVVFANPTHNPADGFSDLATWVLEHLQQVSESLDDDLQELLFVWPFSD